MSVRAALRSGDAYPSFGCLHEALSHDKDEPERCGLDCVREGPVRESQDGARRCEEAERLVRLTALTGACRHELRDGIV